MPVTARRTYERKRLIGWIQTSTLFVLSRGVEKSGGARKVPFSRPAMWHFPTGRIRERWGPEADELA